MVKLTRVGKVIVLEYFTEEEKRILDGRTNSEEEQQRHLEMVRERDFAFAEIHRVYKRRQFCGDDPLCIEPDKYRNQNALANPFLRM